MIWIVFGWSLAWHAAAEPLDLTNSEPRWIEVRFEISPADEPGKLDGRWSEARSAYLEPDPLERIVRIRIPSDQVEAQLRSAGTDTIPGSFSEFLWVLEPDSGRVLTAGLKGQVREHFRLGPFPASAQVDIEVEMTTEAMGGFDPGHGVLGVQTFRFCAPADSQPECVGVAPARFDPSRGYVNAVGSLRAKSTVAEIRAFSPLGEVKFLEKKARGTEAVVSGTSQAEAVCSQAFTGPCRADLGGES